MRPNSNTPINDNSNSSDNKGNTNNKTRAASNSKGRRGSQTPSERRTPPNSNTEDIKASPSSTGKRKTKPASDMEPNSSSEDTKGNKRMRTNSNCGGAGLAGLPIPSIKTEPLPPPLDRSCPSPVLIDCPHPNCNKKYKHINGLKYHQARAHNDDDVKLDLDGDSEYGEDSTLHPDPGNCNGASISQKGCLSPARSVTPKGRTLDVQSPSPSPGKFGSKQSKKKIVETDAETGGIPTDGCEDGLCLTDEASNDGIDDKRGSDRSKKGNTGTKADKVSQKNMKSPRPIGPGTTAPQQMYSFPPGNSNTSPGLAPMVQGIPKSPQMKGTQAKPPAIVDPASSTSKDKKKKDKKKKDGGKEADSPKPAGKGVKLEEGKLQYPEPSDQAIKAEGLLNGSSDPHQSRLASIKAEADKIYSFSDNAPSPSIGVASRIDGTGMPQPHVVNQNGADNSSVKTNSPAYSDISDAGEDGEGKSEGVKARTEDQAIRESVKKALFPNQTPNKDSPYYPGYETYYSPNYINPSVGGPSPATPVPEGHVKIKKDDDQDQGEDKVKVEVHEERKPDSSAPGQQQQQQPSVIQQRSNMYMQPLYYNQYAYVPPYAYHPDQAYHNHLMNTNPAYRQQYEERQRQMAEQHRAAEKKSDVAIKEREVSMKEEWKQKSPMPPSLSKAPNQSDIGKTPQPPSKSRDLPSDHSSKTIKGEDLKSQQAEGLKMKLTEGGHHGKEDSKQTLESRSQAGMEQAMWYRQVNANVVYLLLL